MPAYPTPTRRDHRRSPVILSSATRYQTALVRTLVDELERVLRASEAPNAPCDQLAQELTRLAARALEAAAALGEAPTKDDSGVHWTARVSEVT